MDRGTTLFTEQYRLIDQSSVAFLYTPDNVRHTCPVILLKRSSPDKLESPFEKKTWPVRSDHRLSVCMNFSSTCLCHRFILKSVKSIIRRMNLSDKRDYPNMNIK